MLCAGRAGARLCRPICTRSISEYFSRTSKFDPGHPVLKIDNLKDLDKVKGAKLGDQYHLTKRPITSKAFNENEYVDVSKTLRPGLGNKQGVIKYEGTMYTEVGGKELRGDRRERAYEVLREYHCKADDTKVTPKLKNGVRIHNDSLNDSSNDDIEI